jgi:hypothetical protein
MLAMGLFSQLPVAAYADYSDYDASDIAWVNSLIDANGMAWDKWDAPDPASPASWGQCIEWDGSSPRRVVKIDIAGLQISTLPGLPSAVTILDCSFNSLAALPDFLTVGLNLLLCNDNQLSALPELPASLTGLNCGNNLLASLPSLPGGLQNLTCGGNLLAMMPNLPSSLTELHCYDNQLTALTVLPAGLTRLRCQNNKIRVIDIATCYDNLTVLDIGGNPVQWIVLTDELSVNFGATGDGAVQLIDYSLLQSDDTRYVKVKANPNADASFISWSFTEPQAGTAPEPDVEGDTLTYYLPGPQVEAHANLTASFTHSSAVTTPDPESPGASTPPKTPQTGDMTALIGLQLALVSLAGAALALRARRKRSMRA